MAVTKKLLLSLLKDLEVKFSKYDHPVILIVEEGEKYVGHLGGGMSKNLFLKDKKHRFYIVSALVNTKLDIKDTDYSLSSVISAAWFRKGGLKMAPKEALGEILQVPLGCVTPFALVNESARDVSLLLDQGFKTQEHCLFHPLSNDMTISLNTHDLDKFPKSIGRDPSYVDLEANRTVGKDQPPDLAALVPSMVPEKVVKPSDNEKNANGKPVNNAHSQNNFAHVRRFVEEILHKTSELLLSAIKEDTMKQHGEHLGTVVSDNNLRKGLRADLKNLAASMIFKNTAYTEGFHAGSQLQPRRL